MLIVALAAGLLTQFFPCCVFAIRSFSKVSATPGGLFFLKKNIFWGAGGGGGGMENL